MKFCSILFVLLILSCAAALSPHPEVGSRAAPKRVTKIGCRKLAPGANGTCQACITKKYALSKKTGNCDCGAGYGSWTITSRPPGPPKGPWPLSFPPNCSFTDAAADKKAGCQCLKCPKGTSNKRPSPIATALCFSPDYTPSVGLRVQLAVMSSTQDASPGLQAGFAQAILQTIKGEYAQDAPAWVKDMTAKGAAGRVLTGSLSPTTAWTYTYDFVMQANASGTLDDLSSYRSSLAARVNDGVCSVTPPGGTELTACDMALLAAGVDPSAPDPQVEIKGAAASPLEYHNASSLPSAPPSIGSGACSGWGAPCDVASGQLCCVGALAFVCELRPQAGSDLNTCVRADGYCRERPEDTCTADWECCGLACGDGRCTNATDACRQGNGGCSALATCSGGLGASPTCTCPPGYSGNGIGGGGCKDIDECSGPLRPQYCDVPSKADCINTNGSYACTCKEGYSTQDGGKTCTQDDPRQCSDPLRPQFCDDDSRADCFELATGFRCTCKAGYTTADAGKTCTDVDECSAALRPIFCDADGRATCNNTEGGYDCACKPGFNTADGGVTCTDVDECSGSNRPLYCDEDSRASCSNTAGGYNCTCKTGYTTTDGGRNCTDVDECSVALRPPFCDVEGRADCVNTEGGYVCTCKAGFATTDAGITCTDVDECSGSIRAAHCDEDSRADCSNTAGGYNCTCKTGYTTTDGGRNCTDIDECSAALRPQYCDVEALADCVNTNGSYSCTCQAGYGSTDGGKTCTDINECTLEPAEGGCSPDAACNNTYGGVDCACKPGFDGDGFRCNECDPDSGGCHPEATCANTTGGYKCQCKTGGTCEVCCWGANFDSGTAQLPPGLGSVVKLTSAIDYSNGGTRFCAVTARGRVACWGYTYATDWKLPPDQRGTNVAAAASNAVSAAGTYYEGSTCAVTPGGAVECWGGNSTGQLDVPGELRRNGSALAVAVGQLGSCAITSRRTLKCWATHASVRVPPELQQEASAASITADLSFCAVTAAGTAACFGGDPALAAAPDGLAGVLSVATASQAACAVTAAGAVRCWGSSAVRLEPLEALSGVKEVALTGYLYAYVSMKDGTLTGHRLGGGDTGGALGGVPFADVPPGLAEVTSVKAGGGYDVCVIIGDDPCRAAGDVCGPHGACVADGAGIRCWCSVGWAFNGTTCVDVDECSLATDDCSAVAECANTMGGYECTCNSGYAGDGVSCTDVDECKATTHDCGANTVCNNTIGGYTCPCKAGGYTETGDGRTCEDIDECKSNMTCHPLATCVNTDGGYRCLCKPRANSTQCAVKCWGQNFFGDASPPAGLGPVVFIAAHSQHVCALTPYAEVRCWGDNSYGQCNVDVRARALALGDFHSCVVTMAGAVKCYGRGERYQAVLDVPQELAGDGAAPRALAMSWFSPCAVTRGGAVRCWPDYGEIPAALRRDGAAVSLAGSVYGFCALTPAHALSCWRTVTGGYFVVPSDLGAVAAVYPGNPGTACAMTAAGVLRCWGSQSGGPYTALDGLRGVQSVAFTADYVFVLWKNGTVTSMYPPGDPAAVDVPAKLGRVTALVVGSSLCAIIDGLV